MHGTKDLDFGCKVRHLEAGIAAMKEATECVLKLDDKDALAICDAYLQICGDVVSGAFLIKSVLSGLKANDAHADSMQKIAWHHALTYMSRAPGHLDRIKHGAAPIFALSENNLADL